MPVKADFEVDYKYDSKVDALFIHVKNDYEYDTSIELDNDIILDFDKKGVPVALELLNASRILKSPKYSLNVIRNIKMSIEVDEKSINLHLQMGVIIHNKNQTQSMDTFTSNDMGIPSIETELASA